jgi:hypothetical protein
MKKCVVTIIAILGLTTLAYGQSIQPYGFFAPGQLRGLGISETAFHFGGGVKLIGSNGLGVGVEVGAAGPKENLATTTPECSVPTAITFSRRVPS